jgi:FecR-like protein
MPVLVFVLMQYMISAKAGLINHVDGQTNARLHEQVPVGSLIQTGPNSHIEVLLNPGSFLRLDENSTVVLDSVELTNIAVRLISGIALLEAADIDKSAPISITAGNLRALIVSSGLYRLYGDTAEVLDGKLQTADSSLTIKRGRQVTAGGGLYEQNKIPLNEQSDAFDLWSQQRSSELARANALARNGYSSGGPYTSGFSNSAVWMYSPLLSGFTFIPGRNYRSYYGYTFVPLFASTLHTVTRSTSRSRVQSSRTGTPRPPSATPSRPAPRPHPTGRDGASHGHSGRGQARSGR